MKNSSGFTLLELSIVLVIIGLVTGGILAGRTLMQAANVRATLSQIQSYNAAALAFKTKYGALPGDISPKHAEEVGMFKLTGNYPESNFEDGLINYSWGDDTAVEYYVFWRHLSEANLIQGNYGADAVNPINPVTGDRTSWVNPADGRLFFPSPRSGDKVNILVLKTSRYENAVMTEIPYNEFHLTPSIASGGMSVYMAYALDVKTDDGMPNTGKTGDTAGTANGKWWTEPMPGRCTVGGSTNQYGRDAQYNIGAGFEDSPSCWPYMKAAF